jgi:hypothetical protein
MTKILGSAEKTFGELVMGDNIYYIDPKSPTEIKFLPVKEVSEFQPKKGYVSVEYFQSSSALELVKLENAHLVPTRKIIASKNATRILSMSMPPTVYFTNKRSLENFMAGK